MAKPTKSTKSKGKNRGGTKAGTSSGRVTGKGAGKGSAKTPARGIETAAGRPAAAARDAAAKALGRKPSKDSQGARSAVASEAGASGGAALTDGKGSEKRAVGSGNAVTKGGGASARPRPAPTKRTTPPASGRYTPPIPRSEKVSPLWVPILMFTCLGVGMLTIILNYVNVLPGPDPSNAYLMAGLALITVGFITATKYH